MDLSLKPVNEALVCEMQKEGALGFSVLWIWPIFGSVFRFSHFNKTPVFRFWCLARFAGFLRFSFWFSVFVNNDGGFSDFSIQCILRFFWFCQGRVHPAVALKLLFQETTYIAFYPFF